MTAKQKVAIVAGIGVLVLIGAFVAGPRMLRRIQSMGSGPQGVVAIGEWVNQGTTVAEMANQADLIVSVRVVDLTYRELREMLPLYEEDPQTPVGYEEDVTPFTDAQMQVIEIYKGSAEDTITVMQTGAVREDVSADAIAFSIEGDPIFMQGSEHILFLVEITNDGVHSTGRTLYRTINPFGRYEIAADGSLITPAHLMVVDQAVVSGLPTTLEDLINQITLAVGE